MVAHFLPNKFHPPKRNERYARRGATNLDNDTSLLDRTIRLFKRVFFEKLTTMVTVDVCTY